MMVELEDVWKFYGREPALRGVTLSVEEGEFVAIMGPSGSGKSTLLNIIGLLDTPDRGRVNIGGYNVEELEEKDRTILRRRLIGFVFQAFHLIPSLTVRENVELPMVFDGIPSKEREERAVSLLKEVGLEDKLFSLPTKLSGGEKQRVAIARALANNPKLILADEPTGNLDSKNGKMVMELLKSFNRKGVTLIVVTHDPEVASMAERIVHIKDGEIV